MKIIAALLVLCSVSLNAHATIQADQGFAARIQKFELDASLGLKNDGLKGLLGLDFYKHRATLVLRTSQKNLLSLELPIVKVTTNACGTSTILAEQNDLDGSHNILVVTDRSQSHCGEDHLKPATDIELDSETLSPRNTARSFFSGLPMVPTNDFNYSSHL